jgi:hypothetical protein
MIDFSLRRSLTSRPGPLRWLLLSALLAAGLSGCVYLRLLELKGQFAEFDRHFRVENGEHFIVHFLHPVLYRDDFTELSKLDPTRVETTPTGKRTVQVYRKLDAKDQPQPGSDIVFVLDFDRDDRLTTWDFAPLFMALAPAPFLEASLRSLGKGKVDEGKHQLQVSPGDLPKVTARPPKRDDIVKRLGPPHEQAANAERTLAVYRYQMQTPRVDEGYEDRRASSIKLEYDPKTDELVKLRGKFCGLKISINFRQLGNSTQVPLETVR